MLLRIYVILSCLTVSWIMKLGYLNILRSLTKKLDVLETILFEGHYDIFGVAEIDLFSHMNPPTIEGYSVITHRNEDGISRLCAYVRNSIQVDGLTLIKDQCAIIIQLAQVSVAMAYNGFTLNPYTDDKIKLSEKARCNNAIDTLDQITFSAKQGLVILGDFNIDFLSDTVPRRRLTNWMTDNDCSQNITSATRSISGTCLDLCLSRLTLLVPGRGGIGPRTSKTLITQNHLIGTS